MTNGNRSKHNFSDWISTFTLLIKHSKSFKYIYIGWTVYFIGRLHLFRSSLINKMPEAPKVTKPALDIPVPGTNDNAAVLASHPIPDNSANPLVFFDINVGGNLNLPIN